MHDVYIKLQMSFSSMLLRAKRHCIAEEPEIRRVATFEVLIHNITVSPSTLKEHSALP